MIRLSARWALASALANLAIIACSAGGGTATPTASAPATAALTATARPLPSATPMPATLTPVLEPPPPAAMNAIALLASASGVPAEIIKLISWEKTVWSDSSLGCPEPGKSYAQVVTSGWKIVLSAPDGLHEFHADTGGRLLDCTEVRARQVDTVNVTRALGLGDALGVTVLRRQGEPPEFKEIAGITDAAETARFTSSLDQAMTLTPRTSCLPIFRVVFHFAAGRTDTFETICAGDIEMITGGQQVWGGKQGRAPVEFGNLIGKYASQVPFPGFPGQ